MAPYKTINYSNDNGISPYGNLFQGIPILQEDKRCSQQRIKLLQYMCLRFSFKSHLALRTQTLVPTRENALPVVLI